MINPARGTLELKENPYGCLVQCGDSDSVRSLVLCPVLLITEDRDISYTSQYLLQFHRRGKADFDFLASFVLPCGGGSFVREERHRADLPHPEGKAAIAKFAGRSVIKHVALENAGANAPKTACSKQASAVRSVLQPQLDLSFRTRTAPRHVSRIIPVFSAVATGCPRALERDTLAG